MCRTVVVICLLLNAAVEGGNDEGDGDVQARFGDYEELLYEDYGGDVIPDLYNMEKTHADTQYNSNRRQFDDPFFKNFVRKQKKNQKQPIRSQQPAKIKATRPPATTIAPVKKQAIKVTEPPQKFERKVVQKEKPLKTDGGKQSQSDKIREFTLMISKLLFHLSKIGEK